VSSVLGGGPLGAGSSWGFEDLWLLLFLVPVYLLWAALWVVVPRWRRRRGRSAAIRFSTLAQAGQVKAPWTLALRRVVRALRLVTVALLLIAMARPQTGRQLTTVSSEGIDIVLVLDTSGSMQALDLDADRPIQRRRNRLEVVKDVVHEFVEGRPNDMVGLVVFGEEAFTQCPLTLDHPVLIDLLDDIEVGIAGDRTAIGSGLGTAVKRLQQTKAKSKVVVLLTDGRSNAGTLAPATAAELAKSQKVKVYAIGAGTRGRAPFLIDSMFGSRVVYQDVEIDEHTLRSIAESTGGSYFRAEDREALRHLYSEIDRLERTEITTKSYVEYKDRYPWLLVPALALLALEVVLLGTRLRALP
jgi:Ca-activated chloride channel family protein